MTNEASGDLSIIDAATQSVVATIPLGKRPRGLAASPDGAVPVRRAERLSRGPSRR